MFQCQKHSEKLKMFQCRNALHIDPHSQYWYFILEWRFHSITAAMGFPLRDKITGGYPIKIPKLYMFLDDPLITGVRISVFSELAHQL